MRRLANENGADKFISAASRARSIGPGPGYGHTTDAADSSGATCSEPRPCQVATDCSGHGYTASLPSGLEGLD